MQDTTGSKDEVLENKLELFQQIQYLFALNTGSLNGETIELMKPLIDGSMSYEEHRAMLLVAMESL